MKGVEVTRGAAGLKSGIKKYIGAKPPTSAIKEYIGIKPPIPIKEYLDIKPKLKEYIRAQRSKTSNIQSYLQPKPLPNEVDVLVENITSDIPIKQKIKNIIDDARRRAPHFATKTSIYQRLLTSLYSNKKAIIFGVSVACTLAIVATIPTTWWGLLMVMSKIGTRYLPPWLKASFSKKVADLTIGGILALSRKNKRVRNFLSTQIKFEIVNTVLRRVGIDPSKTDLTAETLIRKAVSNGVMLGTTDVSSYLMTTVVNTAIGYTITGVTKGATKVKEATKKGVGIAIAELSKVPRYVSDTLFAKPPEAKVVRTVPEGVIYSTGSVKIRRETDVLRIAKEVDTKVTITEPESVLPAPKLKKTGLTATKTMVLENNTTIIALAKTTALLTVAFTLGGGPEGVLAESVMARQAVFQLANQVGFQKVIDNFIDYITPDQLKKIDKLRTKALKAATKKQKDSYISRIFAILLGETFYTERDLRELNLAQLKVIAINKGIPPKTGGKKTIIQSILGNQTLRLNNMAGIVSQALIGSVKATVGAVVLETAYQNMPYINFTTQHLDAELAKIKQEVPEDIEASKRAFARVASETQAKLAAEKISKLAELKKTRPVPEGPTRAEYIRTVGAAKLAKRKLADAAVMDALARDTNFIVTDASGVSHPIPIDTLLLDQRILKVLGDVEFTPLVQYVSQQAIKSSVSWIPGIGWVNDALMTTNWSLDVAEKLKDLYKITNVILKVADEKGESKIDIGEENIRILDSLLKVRVPTLSDAINEYVKVDKVNLRFVVLSALRDKVVYGWDNKRVAYEVGKKIAGEGAVGMAENTLAHIGELLWGALGST